MDKHEKKIPIYPTRSKWNLTYHSHNNPLWRECDYVHRCYVSSFKDFWNLYNNSKHVGDFKDNDYFLMRDGIAPTWENKMNKNGVIVSIQIPDPIIMTTWTILSALIVGESFCPKNYLINGISIKYIRENKKNKKLSNVPFALVKIWIRTADRDVNTTIRNFFRIVLPKYVDPAYAKHDFSIQVSNIKAEY
jgi:hypothetical protein